MSEGKTKLAEILGLLEGRFTGDLYDVAHDMETVNEALALIAAALNAVGAERAALAEYVERDKTLTARGHYLADMKSALQSIQRTLREV